MIHRELSGADMMTVPPGHVIEVITGEVVVFGWAPDQRRLPVTTVSAGNVIVGCTPAGGMHLGVAGLPGTEVRHGPVTPADTPALDRFEQWAETLGRVAAAGQWPTRFVAPEHAGQMLSPGEHVGGHTTMTWVQVTAGTTTLCSVPGATIGADDSPVALSRNAWLTAGLRTQVQPCAPPSSTEQWLASLDSLGAAVLAATIARRSLDAAHVADTLTAQAIDHSRIATDAVDVLVRAVGATTTGRARQQTSTSQQFEATIMVAAAAGLAATEEALDAAAEQVAAGRNPVVAVAAAHDARVRPLSLADDWWTHEGAPMVVDVSDPDHSGQRPAAAIWQSGWIIVDPIGNTTQRVTAASAAIIDRHAVTLAPVLASGPATQTDLVRLAVRRTRRDLTVVVAVTALLAVVSFSTPWLLGQVAQQLADPGTTNALTGLFAALALVVGAAVAWQAVRSQALLRARSQVVVTASGALWDRTMRQSARWHAQHPLGVRTSAAAAAQTASGAVRDQTLTAVLDAVVIVGVLGAAATVSVSMTVALGSVFALQIVVTAVLLRATNHYAQRRMAADAVATGRLIELLKAVNRLRMAGAESAAFAQWARPFARQLRAEHAGRRVAKAQGVAIAVWPVVALVVVVAIVSVDDVGLGGFVTAQTAASLGTMAIAAVGAAANGAVVGNQALRLAGPTLQASPESASDGAQPGTLQGAVALTDVVFRYGPNQPEVLNKVNLSVRAGEHIAIVGPSGCGKTTLLRILLGLETPESGTVSFDGMDLGGLDQFAVRRQIGSVLQSSALVGGTIRDNVAMGRTVNTRQVWTALDGAAIGDDIRALTMGIDTPMTDGPASVSGGQRQRILIARALVGNPRLLVLDEATSALDNISQSLVVETLERQRVTRIVVAHRLSTVRHADRVVVMDAGKVVDEGTFDELLGRPGLFADLAHRQLA